MLILLRRIIPMLAVVVALAIPGASRAGLTVSTFTGDAGFTSITNFSKVTGATTRIGNNGLSGDWELGIVKPDDSPFVQDQFSFTNGTSYDFSLTLSGSTLTYTFGGKTLNQSITKDGLNDLFIRARGTAEDSVVLSELKFLDATNTQILQGQLSSVSAHGNGGPNAGYLRISGGGLASGFTLSGKMAFSWSGSAPSGSNLIGQFKLGTNPDVAAVPEPSTLALAASAVVPVCLVAVRRIRRRRAGLD